MSIGRMQAAWTQSKATNLARFLLVAIADNASDDGFAWPGLDYLHSKTKISKRHITRLIKQLHNSGELWVEQHYETGGKTHYIITLGLDNDTLIKTLMERCGKSKTEATLIVADIRFRLMESVGDDTESTPGDDTESRGGRHRVRQGMTQSLPNHHKPSTKPKESISKEIAPKNKQHDHPAIQAYRSVYERYPSKNTYKDIIDKVGEDPSRVERWEKVCTAWKQSGYKPTNLKGQFDWLDTGIPNHNGGKTHGNSRHTPTNTTKRRTGHDLASEPTFNPYTGQTVPAHVS